MAGALALLAAFVPGAAAGLSAQAPADEEEGRADGAPSLVVLLVVDQLRADLLDRYQSVFTGGLARLRDEGFRFTRATHDHAVTLTAPGHATLATGTLPWKHGVVANAWFERRGQGWVTVENVLDDAAPLTDAREVRGASPRVLERDGLADWMAAAHPDARVVSVSAKARSAVLMGGRSGGLAVWFDDPRGRFVTSTHYLDELPDWLNAFNDEVVPGLAGEWVWDLSVPETFRALARTDEAPWEGDGVHTTFPHRFEDSEIFFPEGLSWAWWATTPPLDRATRLLAQEAAVQLELGTDEVPDLLAVSLSQTDRVGHAYGPLSLEQLDNLYRLDQEVGAFLSWLDERYGPEGYVVAVSADHGVADAPEAAREQGLPGFRITRDSAIVLQQHLNRAAAAAGTTDQEALSRALATALPELSWIEEAWTTAELQRRGQALLDGPAGQDGDWTDGMPADSFAVLQARSTYPGRLTGILARQFVEMRFSPYTVTWAYPRGSTHGSPYLYDRHVPFILFGRGVTPGVSDVPVSTADVAPTLAEILGLDVPPDLDGQSRWSGAGEGGPEEPAGGNRPSPGGGR